MGTAPVSGISSQDGSYLTEHLRDGEYCVAGLLLEGRAHQVVFDGIEYIERDYANDAAQLRVGLRDFLAQAKAKGRTVAALSASIEHYMLQQYCGLTNKGVVEVGEVNPDKFHAMTLGTCLPINLETDVLTRSHDYYLVLPWCFHRQFLANSGYSEKRLVFPLPMLQSVHARGELV